MKLEGEHLGKIQELEQEVLELKSMLTNGDFIRFRQIEQAVSRLSAVLISKQGSLPPDLAKQPVVQGLLKDQTLSQIS
jgi:hypothetical protein